MKVFCINSVNYGSTGNIMLDIAAAAREKGHQVITASSAGRDMKTGIEDHIFIGNRASRRIAKVLSKKTCSQGKFSYMATKKLIKKVNSFSPDVIHIHNLHNEYINLKLFFKYIKRKKVKVIWTLHDAWAFTGRCACFSAIDCNKWQKGCGNCPDLTKYPAFSKDSSAKEYLRKKSIFTEMENLTIVTPSRWLAGLVKQSFLKEYPVKVVNNGINLEVFKPTINNFRERYQIGDKKILLGVAFGWNKDKGLSTFIELAQKLDEQKYQIVLVGTDDNVDRDLPSNIISIHRTQSQKELAEIYSAADLFINPTREDNYPTVNLESIACGTPVVTFNSGGSSECIGENCGSWVERDDILGLEKEIKRICENDLCSTQACIQRSKNFDKKDMALQYVELYEN